jgi:hypothetical protein
LKTDPRVHLQDAPALLDALLIEMGDAKRVGEIGADAQREGVEARGLSQLVERLAIFPRDDEVPGVPLMRRRIIWVQRDRSLVLDLGGAPIPKVKVQGEGKRGMRLSEIVVERERSVRGGPRLRKGVLGRQHPVLPIARKRVGISKPRVRLRIGRIGLDRLVE